MFREVGGECEAIHVRDGFYNNLIYVYIYCVNMYHESCTNRCQSFVFRIPVEFDIVSSTRTFNLDYRDITLKFVD